MKCRNCKHYHHDWCAEVHDDPYPDMERNCKYYKIATNADRIRCMTDEELAEWICDDVVDGTYHDIGNFLPIPSVGWWLNWLGMEVDDEKDTDIV